MKKVILVIVLIQFIFSFTFAQTGTLTGTIKDDQSKSIVPFANIIIQQSGKTIKSATSDIAGKYIITELPSGTYTLIASYVGYNPYKDYNVKIENGKTKTLNILLKLNHVYIKDVIIMGEETENISYSVPSNIINMDVKHLGNAEYSKSIISIQSNDSYQWQQNHNTEEYDLINENIFHKVRNEPLSTFSIDVDKASYSNLRRFLNNNNKAPVDAIRIEEMINYFDYDYPQPTGEHPFSVSMEINSCPWNSSHELVLIGLQGKMPDIEEIPASNLVFLIDVSGSMGSQNKLPLLKQSFKILVDKLRPQDRVAMVVYAGAAGMVLNSTSGNNKKTIINALDNLQSGGSTAGGAGINLAYKIAVDNFIKGGNNRVILATDGDFNVGASSNAEMERLIIEKREYGVFLSVLGFGMGNYKDAKMEQISNAGNGNYAYIDNILEAKKVFGHELWGTLFTIAKDVKIQIEFNPAKIESYRLIGYENRMLQKEDFNDDKKDAGEIGAGHKVTALYEIVRSSSVTQPTDNVDPLEYQKMKTVKSKNLLTLKLRYKLPNENESRLIKKYIKETKIRSEKASDNFLFASSVAGFGMLLRNSEFKGNLTFNDVEKLARLSKGKDENGYRAEFIKLIEIAKLLYVNTEVKDK